jgi:hypothetical protein
MAKLKAGTIDNESVDIRRAKGGPKTSPEKKLLFKTLKSILSGRSDSMKFGELFERVKEAGVAIGGTDERKNLAVFLNRFSCFMTEGRRGGWRYLPERDYEADDDGQPLSDQIDRDITKISPEGLTLNQAKFEHARLVDEIRTHNQAYYQKDAPNISDAEYDALRKRCEEIATRFGFAAYDPN